jgi:hypothetical protein
MNVFNIIKVTFKERMPSLLPRYFYVLLEVRKFSKVTLEKMTEAAIVIRIPKISLKLIKFKVKFFLKPDMNFFTSRVQTYLYKKTDVKAK